MTSRQPQDDFPQQHWTAPPPPPAPPPPALPPAPLPPPPPPPSPASGAWLYAPWLYAPWRRRALGFVLDGVIAIIAGVVFSSVFATSNAAPVGELVAVTLLQWMQSRTGATFGKAAVGLRLIDLNSGNPPTFVVCVCRWLLHFLDAIFLIGFLAPLVTRRKQTFADMIAKTVVVLA
jgi:Mce-associated membrane protein